MAFVRKKRSGGHDYYQLVENYREDGKHKQRVLAYLGKHATVEDAIAELREKLAVLEKYASSPNGEDSLREGDVHTLRDGSRTLYQLISEHYAGEPPEVLYRVDHIDPDHEGDYLSPEEASQNLAELIMTDYVPPQLLDAVRDIVRYTAGERKTTPRKSYQRLLDYQIELGRSEGLADALNVQAAHAYLDAINNLLLVWVDRSVLKELARILDEQVKKAKQAR